MILPTLRNAVVTAFAVAALFSLAPLADAGTCPFTGATTTTESGNQKENATDKATKAGNGAKETNKDAQQGCKDCQAGK